MYLYITSGTYHFLKSIKEKNAQQQLHLLQNNETSQLWHETEKTTIFQSPRKYQVLESIGNFEDEGIIACQFISVRDEDRPVLEYDFINKFPFIKEQDGLIAARFLRPLSNDSYIIATMWDDLAALKNWQDSPTFTKFTYNPKMLNIFSGANYTAIFFITDEELDHTVPDEN